MRKSTTVSVFNKIAIAAAASCVLGNCSPAPARAPTSELSQMLTAPGACFARTYDDAHLAAHPSQTVRRFFLGDPGQDWRPTRSEGQFNVAFGFQVIGRQDTYSGIGICELSEVGAECDIEGDGGAFSIERNGEGLRIIATRMEVEGPNDFSDDLALGDNRLMLLQRAAPDACASAS